MLGKITGLLAAASLVACSDHATQEQEDGSLASQEQEIRIPDDLKQLRQLTSRYHSLDAADRDGFAFGINGLLQVCVLRWRRLSTRHLPQGGREACRWRACAQTLNDRTM